MKTLPQTRSRNRGREAAIPRPDGFTLVELLVVIGILGVLAGLLLPALEKAQGKARAIGCLSNLKQLQLAWHLYSVDHNDRLVLNGLNYPTPPRDDLHWWWAQGTLNFDGGNSENTNTVLLTVRRYALLGPYLEAPGVFKCPSDRSTVYIRHTPRPRARSVSLNMWMGGIADCLSVGAYPIGYQKQSGIVNPPPSSLFVFVDEHPDSIESPSFLLENEHLAFLLPPQTLVSFPSSLHDGAGTLSFADGHVELHRWRDPRTKPPVNYAHDLVNGAFTPNNPDLAWLQEHGLPPEDQQFP